MSRSVPEWIGRDDDDPVPPRVRLRVWEAKGGRCHRCTRKIMVGETWTCEHVKAVINHNGMNRESNLDLTCCNCLKPKKDEDLAIKSKTYAMRTKHLGIETKPKYRWGSRPFQRKGA